MIVFQLDMMQLVMCLLFIRRMTKSLFKPQVAPQHKAGYCWKWWALGPGLVKGQGMLPGRKLTHRQVYGPPGHRRNFSQLSLILFPGSGAFSAAVVLPYVWDMSRTPTSSSSFSSSSSQKSMFPAPRERGWRYLPPWAVLGLQLCPSCQQHMCISPDSEEWPWGGKAVGDVGNPSQAVPPWSTDPLRNQHSTTLPGVSVAFVWVSSEEAGPASLDFIQWVWSMVLSLALSFSSFLQWQPVSVVVLLTPQLYELMNTINHHFSCFIFFFFLRRESVQFCTDLYLFFKWALKIVNRIFITYSHQKTPANKGIFC